MQKIHKILLCLLLCASLFGCSYSGNTADLTSEIVTTQNYVTENAEKSTSKVTAAISSQPKNEEKSTAKFTKNSQKTTISSNTSVVSSNHKNKKTTKKTHSTTAKPITEEQTKNTSSPVTDTTAVTEATSTASIITCEVTIECTSVLDNMDKLKKGHEAYVPSDGVFINTYMVTLDAGATAYDAIAAACRDKNVKLTESNDGYGKYIIGFNNIDEKDCGKQSGWIYKINGVKPIKSCNKYKLQNGDKVLFTYTCSY